MSTKALVGMEITHDRVKYISVNCDGYFTGVGAGLMKSYTSRSLTEKLLDLGDRRGLDEGSRGETYAHNYHGDWKAKIADSQLEYMMQMSTYGAEFAYLQNMEGEWVVYSRMTGWWRNLKSVLARFQKMPKSEFTYHAVGYISDEEYYSARITLRQPAKQTRVEKSDVMYAELWVEKYKWFRKAYDDELDEIQYFMHQEARPKERLPDDKRKAMETRFVTNHPNYGDA